MKKNRVLIVVLIISFILLIASCSVLLIDGFIYNNKMETISKKLDLNLKNCTLEIDKDTHGGLLGDGEYFAKISFKENDDSKILFEWKVLPLSTELQTVMNMISYYNNEGGKNVYERYNIPNIENGYYYFLDRYSDAVNKDSEEELNSRSSYNFSLGIYDSKNKILYFYELDT